MNSILKAINWFKAIKLGIVLAKGLVDAAEDGKITYEEVMAIGRCILAEFGIDLVSYQDRRG